MAFTTTTTSDKLGDILIASGVITPFELEDALQEQRISGEHLGRVLVRLGLLTEQDVVEALCQQEGIEKVDLSRINIRKELLTLVDPTVARFYNVIPIRKDDDSVTLAMVDPLNLTHVNDLEKLLGCHIKRAVATWDDIQKALDTNYSHRTEDLTGILSSLITDMGSAESMDKVQRHSIEDADNLAAMAQQPEVIRLMNLVFLQAVESRASDIHFEPFEDMFRIRIRIDGALVEVARPPREMALAITSRVKVISGLDISERRLPQDGRIQLKIGNNIIDIRVSTLPTLYGESGVLRLLDKSAAKLTVEDIGFDPDTRDKVLETVEKPTGIFLVTGPTGSGKSSTLYACMSKINRPEVKIVTVEDPVEYQMDGLSQVPIQEEIGLTFSNALRSILRMDPDILMVGECRDFETAKIAIEAALTGHLVFSTLHTNDAPSSITRLIDMGVEAYLISSTLRAILAQRLVRTLCSVCKEKSEFTDDELRLLQMTREEVEGHQLYRARKGGCESCGRRGYRGRCGIFEMMMITNEIRDMINAGATVDEMRDVARRDGMKTLREAGILRIFEGITTPAEVIEITQAYT